MITNLQTLIQATGAFNTVQLAQDLEVVDDYENDVPGVILYRGDTVYGENTLLANGISQSADKIVTAFLVCPADDIETLEDTIITTLVGYQHAANYDPLVAAKAENYRITGHYYWRKLSFVTRTWVRKV